MIHVWIFLQAGVYSYLILSTTRRDSVQFGLCTTGIILSKNKTPYIQFLKTNSLCKYDVGSYDDLLFIDAFKKKKLSMGQATHFHAAIKGMNLYFI